MMITETTVSTVLPTGGGKIRRSSFKSRGTTSNGGAQINSGVHTYAVRMKVPSTAIAEIASKFNAVVVDADSNASARDIIKKVNKTLAKGTAIRATVEKFESVTEKKHGDVANSMVLVRTNSDHRAAEVIKAAVVAEQRSPSSSIVKRRMEQFQAGNGLLKPKFLGPKPNVSKQRKPMLKETTAVVRDKHLLTKHKRLSIARDPDAQLESVLNVSSPLTPSFQSPKSRLPEQLPLLSPLSKQPQLQSPPSEQIPQPSSLSELPPQLPSLSEQPSLPSLLSEQSPSPPTEVKQEQPPAPSSSPPVVQPKLNCSFLHSWKKPTAVDDDEGECPPMQILAPVTTTITTTITASTTTTTTTTTKDVCNDDQHDSFLHGYTKKMADGDRHDYNNIGDDRPQDIYEELEDPPNPLPLPDVVLESTHYDGDNDHHYTTIEGGEQNIYDDVIATAAVAQDRRKRPATATDEDGRYETVQAPLLPLPLSPTTPVQPLPLSPTAPVQPVTTVVVTPALTDSDYENSDRVQKKISDSSMEIDNSIYGLNPPSESTSSGVTSDSVSASRNSKFEIDDEWVDVDNTSDELQEIIVFRQKPKINDTIMNGWSEQVRKQLTKSYETKDTTNTISQEIPEEIYADYDSFESDDSSDGYKDGSENIKRVSYPCENRVLPALPSQKNIYGLVPLVKKARNRMKKRWSLGSLGLNRIKKFGMGNLTTDFSGNKTYEDTSDKSVENKFLPSTKFNSLSASIFYLEDPIYNNIENGQIRTPIRNASKPPSSIDSRRLSVARPNSPPPPPPVKRHSTGSNACDSLPQLIYNSKGRPGSLLDKSNNESVYENGSNQGSDLCTRFADEPLYQFYAAGISERTKSVFAGDMMEECDGYEEISSITSRPSALELITPCPSGHGQHRSLWCEVPEVKNSGIIDTLNPRERKLQEAKFELITSEASYFKSLTVLEKHFVNSHSMNDETILSKNDRKILFGNVNPVRKCSEKLLAALEKCWQDNILLQGLCEILLTHSKENFDIFVKYCSNQIYIDRTLKSLREKNLKFNEALQRLESDPKCQSLSLHSFLMLPMQRITRLPLLVDAILSQMNSSENSTEFQNCESTLAYINSIVQDCNESTRKLERYEEMLLLSQQLEFSSKREIKAMSVASSSRWLVRSGSMLHLTSPDAKLTFSRKLIRRTKLYFFLFNDMFFIAKRKSDENYTVVDYCLRNFVQMVDAAELVISSPYKNLLMLTILENHERKTIEMLLSCESESSKKRWIEAMSPPISSNPDETLYNEWDCPQVFVEHAYTAIQPDELSLQTGDIVKVLTKMNDGWYHGERIRDGEKGWFPGNYTSEIASQHARAKNLKQRYRLLAMSKSYLQSQQDKIKKK